MNDEQAPDYFARIRPFVQRHEGVLDLAIFTLIAGLTLAALLSDHLDTASFGVVVLLSMSAYAHGPLLKALIWGPAAALAAAMIHLMQYAD